MNKNPILLGIIIIILFVIGVAREGQSAPKQQSVAPHKEQPRMGGTLVFGLDKEFANPNPFIANSSIYQFVKETAYESLLTRDDDGRFVANLAKTYDISSSGKEFTLHLRKGVKFHNGKEMQADDVVWSVNHVKDPKNGAYGQNKISNVKYIEKIDNYTVKFVLEKPSGVFISLLANIQMLPIVPANSLQVGQIKLDKDTFVPGTGPFMFEQFMPGFDMVVKKSPEYWGKPAYLDKIIFRPITDNANRFNALRTGDVHMASRLGVLDVARVKKGDVKGIGILEEPLGGFSRLCFNRLNPLFQKKEMRQAVLYAFDKKRLVDEAFFGAAQPTELMMDPQGIWSKAANLPPQKRDLVKAKALLKTAGYNGQEFVLIEKRAQSQLAEACQRMLGEAGIKLKVEILEAGVLIERRIAGKYDFYIDGGTLFDDPVTTMFEGYHSNKVQVGRYSNPKVDQLFDSLSAEFDQKKRLKIFKELAWTIRDDVADAPLFFEIRYLGLAEKVNGFGPPKGYNYIANGNYFKNAWLN